MIIKNNVYGNFIYKYLITNKNEFENNPPLLEQIFFYNKN